MDIRDNYFDNLKGILILLVVLGHILVECITTTNNYYWFYASIIDWIYLFHMPLFVFVSGYFSKSRKIHFGELYIPFAIANIFTILIQRTYVHPLLTPVGSAWYFFTLIQYRLLIQCCIPNIGHRGGGQGNRKGFSLSGMIVSLAFINSLLCIFIPRVKENTITSNFVIFLPFFLMGYYYEGKMLWLRNKRILGKLILTLSFLVVMYMNCITKMDVGSFYLSCDIREIDINVVIKSVITYIVAIILSVALLMATSSAKSIITRFGKQSASIYFFHMLLIPFMHLLDRPFINPVLGIPVAICFSIFICIFFVQVRLLHYT